MKDEDELSKAGQGYNDARGEVLDQKDIPKANGQNLNNDPAHHRANEKPGVIPMPTPESKTQINPEDAKN